MRRSAGLIGLFGLALTVRVACLVELSETPFLSVLLSDAARYDSWAREIASGHWWGDDVFYQAPLYPYFLATCYALLGRDLLLVRLVQIVMGAAGCVLLAQAGRSFFSSRVGLAAGLCLALYPQAVFFDLLMQKAALANFLLLLLLALVGRLHSRFDWPTVIGAGVVLGLLALTRENTRILCGVLVPWLLLLPREPLIRRLTKAAAFTLGLAIVLLPVALRNQHMGGDLLLTTSQLGPNFYIGNNPDADGTYRALRPGRGNPQYERQDAIDLAESATGRSLSATEVSDYWLARSWSYMRDQPGHWSRLMVRKWLLVWNAEEQADAESIEAYAKHSRVLWLLSTWLHFGVLLPVALIGLWASRARWRELGVLYAVVLSLALSVALFFVFARYRYSLVPVLALFAGAGAIELVTRIKRHEWRQLAVAITLAAVGAVVANLPLSVQLNVEAMTYNNLGIALAGEGEVAAAADWYQSAVATDPDYAAAHYNLGVALLEQDEVDAAVDQFQQTCRIEPDFTLAHQNLGLARVRQGQLDAAVKHYRDALHIEPRNAEIHSNLGVALELMGDFAGAVSAYRVAIEESPDLPAAHYNLGNVQLALENYAAAGAAYREALRLRPDDAAAHYNLGITCYQQGQGRDAVQHVRAAVAAEPDFVTARFTLGRLLVEQGQIEEAIVELRQVLRQQPDREDVRAEIERLLAQEQTRAR